MFDAKKKVYSFSKLSTINQCEYQAFLTYIEHQKGSQNCYSIMGTKMHDTLEAIMNDKATEKDLYPALQSELSDIEMLNIRFPKDRNGNDSIRDNWIKDMTHFCNNFIRPKGKYTTEELFIYKLSEDRYIQGYIDLVKHNSDGTISIYDWKTSSQFSKADLIEHGRQLILYGLGKEAEGFKIKNLAWIMLKYIQVDYIGKSRSNSKVETLQIKVIDRWKLVQELKEDIENNLYKLDYDEVDVECLIHSALESNSLDVLPKEIKERYTIKPYVRKYEFTDELKQETLKYINEMADKFESKGKNESEWEHKKFTKTSTKGKETDDSFFCNILCNHKNTCKYLKQYNDLRVLNKIEDEDLF